MNVSIQTLGCKLNFAEMAELGDRLARAGFAVSDGDEHADICVINSCTVTAQADRKLRTVVHGLRRRHPQAQPGLPVAMGRRPVIPAVRSPNAHSPDCSTF